MAAAPGTVGFLYTDSASVVFLQWPTDGSGHINGTVKEDDVSGNAGSRTIADHTGNFTGQVSQGSEISLAFSGSWGTVYGTDSGGSLSLNLPEQGGGLQPTIFHDATPVGYNSALAVLRNSVDQGNQQAEQQQQAAAQAQAQSTALQALSNDLASLTNDESKVSPAVAAITSAEREIDSKSTGADGKLAAEKAYAGPNADCYQLGNMEYTTNSAVYDLNSAVYALTGTISDLDDIATTLGDDIGQAQKDEQAVTANGAIVPSGTDSKIAAASSATTDAKGEEQKATTYGDNATKHGQEVSSSADSLATNCNSGG